jgi:hypothetical protein
MFLNSIYGQKLYLCEIEAFQLVEIALNDGDTDHIFKDLHPYHFVVIFQIDLVTGSDSLGNDFDDLISFQSVVASNVWPNGELLYK